MTRSRYGMLAAIAGAAFAAWWSRRQSHTPHITQAQPRGETIYRNTPEPTGLGGGPT